MADNIAERANKKMYGLVYSRATSGRGKPNEMAMDNVAVIKNSPKEMMMNSARGTSNSVRYRAKESLSERHIDNFKGQESTKMITVKGKSKAVCSMQKESWTGEGIPTGNGQTEVENTVPNVENENIDTPMKQKKGADGEIVRDYFLSTQQSLSRLRPRKEIPAFRIVNLEEDANEFVVGKRIKVYWPDSRRWFTGRIVAFDNRNSQHKILYEDGDEEVLDLRKERFELEVMPADSFKLKVEPHSARKADGLDAGNVREALVKQSSKNITGAKTMTKSSESKQKNETKKEGKSTNPKAYRKDNEVIKEHLFSNADVIPEKVGELVTNKANRIEESGKALEDDSLEISIAELARKPKGSRKGLMPRAKRMRTDKAVSREFGNVSEKLEADMKSHVLQGKAKLENSESDKESKEGIDFISVKHENYSIKESRSNDGVAS